MFNQVIVCVLLTMIGFSRSYYYTNPNLCPRGDTHTMIRYPMRPSPACGRTNYRGLTPQRIDQIVNLHNKLRYHVAKGLERMGSYGPQPPATNMQYLEWDEELAEIAQRWADQCIVEHDDCRNVDRFNVGQNIGWGYKSAPKRYDELYFVQAWYDEVKYFDQSNVYNFNPVNFKQIGHYSQMLWAGTTQVGCGSISYDMDGLNYLNFVCNYGPSGNVVGTKMYEVAREHPSSTITSENVRGREMYEIRRDYSSPIVTSENMRGREIYEMTRQEFSSPTNPSENMHETEMYGVGGGFSSPTIQAKNMYEIGREFSPPMLNSRNASEGRMYELGRDLSTPTMQPSRNSVIASRIFDWWPVDFLKTFN